jgi:peptidoglycan hydrolase CwlO-like protein
MAEIDDLRKQLEDLNKQIKEAGGLGIDFDEAIKRAGTDVKILQTYIAQLNKQLNDTINNSEYIYRTFQDLTSELSNQNLLLKFDFFDFLNCKFLINFHVFFYYSSI